MDKAPSMTRAHYEYLAALAPAVLLKVHACLCALAVPNALGLAPIMAAEVMKDLAHHLKGTNPNFNYDRFMQHVQDLLDQKEKNNG